MTFKIKNKKVPKKVYVGDIGKYLKITKKKKGLKVYYVEEEDGSKRWYLIPERSDIVLKTAKVDYKQKNDIQNKI